MKIAEKDVKKNMEFLALQSAGGMAFPSIEHGCRICRMPVGSWQAEIIRKKADMPRALNPMEFRKALKNPSMPIIFLPREAIVTQEVVERICGETSLHKMVIWETD